MNSICVYCGANAGANPKYADGTRALAVALAEREITLVYGGGSVGLMGILADTMLEAGGHVVGVLPRHLHRKEVAHQGLTELHVVNSMHERKALMADRSDAFIALPGGLGTLEELFEVLTWTQLGVHAKPCGLLNIADYYGRLSHFLDHAVSERFIRSEHRAMLLIENDPAALLQRLETWRPPRVEKWLDRDET